MSSRGLLRARVALLLPYQQRWVADQSRVQVSIKSRRIGITWASALRAVIEGARARGGNDTYYTGYKTDLAKEFIREAGEFARALNAQVIATGEELFKDVDKDGNPREILAYTITFASGNRIVALSSSPRNLRGIQGRVIIDEAAFHDNLPELLKAAMATLMWGGKVSIISTHNGVDNPFNLMLEDIAAGKFGYTVHKTTLDDAIGEGLYERVATVLGLEISDDAKAQWRQELIDFYGDGADEELFCIPRKGGGIYLGPGLVEACMSADCHVHRIRVDDAFTHLPKDERNAKVDEWLTSVVANTLDRDFSPRRPIFAGQDFGRKSDITAIALGQDTQDLKSLVVPAVIELRNVPYDAQQRFVEGIFQRLPKFGRAAVDATGNGAPLGEHLQQQYGEELVLAVGPAGNSWGKWYPEQLPKFKAAFEDQRIIIPKDFDIRKDLTAFQVVNGVPTLPKVRAAEVAPGSGKTDYRHGDAGVALALLEYAHRTGEVAIEHHRVETPAGRFGPRGSMW